MSTIYIRAMLVALLLFSVLWLSGCNGSSPEAVVRQKHGENVTIQATRVSGTKAVVFSSTGNTIQLGSIGWSDYVDVLARDSTGWVSKLSYSAVGDRPDLGDSKVCAAVMTAYDSDSTLSLVYGYTRLPDVALVEVDFSGGDLQRDRTSDGFFAVLHEDAVLRQAKELRALDQQGRVLATIDLLSEFPQPGIGASESMRVPEAAERMAGPPSCRP